MADSPYGKVVVGPSKTRLARQTRSVRWDLPLSKIEEEREKDGEVFN